MTTSTATLNELLKILREHGVKSYKGEGLEVEFSDRAGLKEPLIDNTAPAAPSKTPEEEYEDDLNWSAP